MRWKFNIASKPIDGQKVPDSHLYINEAVTLDILGIKIQSYIRWNEHVFQVPQEAFKCLGI